jgi:hypothetical protein
MNSKGMPGFLELFFATLIVAAMLVVLFATR